MQQETEKSEPGQGMGNSWQAIRLVFPFFRQYKLRLAIGFLSLLAVNGLQLVIPRIIKHAVDSLQSAEVSQASLLRYGIMIFGLAVCIAVFRFGWRFMILGFSRHLEKDFRNWLFSHLLTLDRIFFQRKTTGEIMALSTNDLAAVQLAGGMGLVAFVDALVLSIAALSFMAYIHPGLTLIAIVPMPLLALLTRFLSGRLHRYFRKVQEQFSKLTEFARTSINSIRMIKVYTLEENQTGRFDAMGKEYVLDNLRLARVHGTLFPVSGFIANSSMLLVLLFGGRFTINGSITIGDFVAFTSYLFMLTWPMMALGWVTNLFQRGVNSAYRISWKKGRFLPHRRIRSRFLRKSVPLQLQILLFPIRVSMIQSLMLYPWMFNREFWVLWGKQGQGKRPCATSWPDCIRWRRAPFYGTE
jgi:ATP-binding cassette subfamily B protein